MDALQQMLVPLCDIPAAEQILIQSGKPLDSRKQLSAYGLPVGIFIALHMRVVPASNSQAATSDFCVGQ